MIEAMACGTPVIAFRGGSVAEVVCEDVSGHICDNAEQMVTRLRSLHFDAATIRRYVKEHFSVDVMVNKYLRLYNSILEPGTSLPLVEATAQSLLLDPGAAA
jgi:glycosyltransferase involved in cell wall biosynthesis